MAYTFNIETQTCPAEGYEYRSAQQREKALECGAVRIYRTAYRFDLPQYVERELAAHGYRAVVIGYTTYQSTTWAICPAEAI